MAFADRNTSTDIHTKLTDGSLISAMVVREDGESRHEYFYFSTLFKRQTYTNIRAYSVILEDFTILKFRERDR